ncbi:MAG: hypothetical protein LBT82_03335 [Oscillospiraceae bacterium]|jgi:hypothetical protein|nr:hypothetical protein [Oscillospiraceae bacterium]
MKNCAQKFLEILKNDEELRKKVENSKSTEERKKIVSPYLNGCSFEEFQNQLKEIEGSLSNEDLMNVSGGGQVGKRVGQLVGECVGKLLYDSSILGKGKRRLLETKYGNIGSNATEEFCDKLKF